MAKFICVPYPFLRVLIERNANPMGGDKYAEFKFGGYETDNKKEIEVLRGTPYVHEDKNMRADNMTVAMEDDQNLITIANLTASGATVVTPTARHSRLTDTERARLNEIKR